MFTSVYSLWLLRLVGKTRVTSRGAPLLHDAKHSPLTKNQKFDSPILTPTTKADYGEHDEPISKEEIVAGLVDKDIYEKAEKYAMELFAEGQKWAQERGLILVDTKYEFGMIDGALNVIDEIHTPDSSRYWMAEEYQERYENGENQLMLDKENIRPVS